MTEPTTSNVGLIIPNTGDLVGTWGTGAVNPDFVALDGYHGGVQTISLSNVPVTLTSPASFTPTPTGGPTQSQNAVLRFTGTLSANPVITLPLPGYYIVENLTTAGGNIVQFRAVGSGEVICVDQGDTQHIFCDGTNVRFVNMGRVAHVEIWAGLIAMPAWVTNCTVPPFLLCDGTVYNFSTYPYLGRRLGGAFGGNGITTFAVPDLRGRVALPYDGTGARITAAVSSITGTQIGSAADNQGITLNSGQVPSLSGSNTITVSTNGIGGGLNNGTIPAVLPGVGIISGQGFSISNGGIFVPLAGSGSWGGINSMTGTNSIVVNGGGGTHSNVQPAQVTGIAVIRAA